MSRGHSSRGELSRILRSITGRHAYVYPAVKRVVDSEIASIKALYRRGRVQEALERAQSLLALLERVDGLLAAMWRLDTPGNKLLRQRFGEARSTAFRALYQGGSLEEVERTLHFMLDRARGYLELDRLSAEAKRRVELIRGESVSPAIAEVAEHLYDTAFQAALGEADKGRIEAARERMLSVEKSLEQLAELNKALAEVKAQVEALQCPHGPSILENLYSTLSTTARHSIGQALDYTGKILEYVKTLRKLPQHARCRLIQGLQSLEEIDEWLAAASVAAKYAKALSLLGGENTVDKLLQYLKTLEKYPPPIRKETVRLLRNPPSQAAKTKALVAAIEEQRPPYELILPSRRPEESLARIVEAYTARGGVCSTSPGTEDCMLLEQALYGPCPSPGRGLVGDFASFFCTGRYLLAVKAAEAAVENPGRIAGDIAETLFLGQAEKLSYASSKLGEKGYPLLAYRLYWLLLSENTGVKPLQLAEKAAELAEKLVVLANTNPSKKHLEEISKTTTLSRALAAINCLLGEQERRKQPRQAQTPAPKTPEPTAPQIPQAPPPPPLQLQTPTTAAAHSTAKPAALQASHEKSGQEHVPLPEQLASSPHHVAALRILHEILSILDNTEEQGILSSTAKKEVLTLLRQLEHYSGKTLEKLGIAEIVKEIRELINYGSATPKEIKPLVYGLIKGLLSSL